MRKLQRLSMAVLFALALGTCAMAGIIETPPAPQATGLIETPPSDQQQSSSSLVTTLAVTLIQIAISGR